MAVVLLLALIIGALLGTSLVQAGVPLLLAILLGLVPLAWLGVLAWFAPGIKS